jgi:hypothetical protein
MLEIFLAQVWTLFEHHHAETGGGQFLRHHAASGPGTYYDEIDNLRGLKGRAAHPRCSGMS